VRPSSLSLSLFLSTENVPTHVLTLLSAPRRSPSTFLVKSLLGTLRSCSFLASFVTLFQGLVCLQRYIYLSPSVPPWIRQLVAHKAWYWFAGLSTGLPLFIEEKKRRRELAMYVLPRGLESVWSVLRAKSYVPFVPGGEVLLTRSVRLPLSLFPSLPNLSLSIPPSLVSFPARR